MTVTNCTIQLFLRFYNALTFYYFCGRLPSNLKTQFLISIIPLALNHFQRSVMQQNGRLLLKRNSKQIQTLLSVAVRCFSFCKSKNVLCIIIDKYQNKLTLTFLYFTLVFPENVTITTPIIPNVETTTKTVESNEKSKEIPTGDSAGNRNNKRACMTKNRA